MVDQLQRMKDFIRTTTALTADASEEIDAGFVFRTPSLPQVWSLNHVRITKPLPVAEMVAVTESELEGLPYLQLHVEHGQELPELERALRERGWKLEREVLMSLRHAPDREVDAGAVIEAPEDQMLELMERWFAEGPEELTADGLEQLVEYARREARARSDRTFAIPGRGGGLAASAKLRADRAVAQIEDVYTIPEARGRGYCRAILTRAIEQARARTPELIFIVANDDDWPKQLYAKIGFEPVGRTLTAHRDRSPNPAQKSVRLSSDRRTDPGWGRSTP
jgi:GNAT superfamily N-acetyltransferase